MNLQQVSVGLKRTFGAFLVVGLSIVLIPGTAAAQSVGPETTFGSGTLTVGKDIAAGTYQTVVPDNSVGCYWARLSDLSGGFDSILANANLGSGEMATVTIKPSDAGFESSRCGTWQPAPNVGPSAPVDTFGDGTWIVGEDIQPGSYRTTVPDDPVGCYWARLENLSGDVDSILANDNIEPGSRVNVTIGAGDAGFTASRCGTWELAR